MKFICEKEKILKGINSVINGVSTKNNNAYIRRNINSNQ